MGLSYTPCLSFFFGSSLISNDPWPIRDSGVAPLSSKLLKISDSKKEYSFYSFFLLLLRTLDLRAYDPRAVGGEVWTRVLSKC